MPFQFTNSAPYRFKAGDIFLGVDDMGQEIGIQTERHAICIAGAGSGKGAAVIIPNLLRWKAAALCIDPKGENAEKTWQAREAMWQPVGVLDPFLSADIPDRLRVCINVLDGIDPASRTARGDVETIADGLVKRSDPKHAEWDDGAASVLAGVIAYVLADPPPEGATLPLIRRVLLQGKDDLYADAQRMLDCASCGGLAKAAGATIMAALEADKGMEKDFLGGARRHSAWLDDPAIADVLSSSTFDLACLKSGRGTLYLVLPPHYIESKAAFLRLFVRTSLNTMAAGGSGKGGRCLFLLDEFYALGKIEIVAKAAGLMRSYGVSLFPFLQDLGQLQELYGVKGSETFFGNADAHIFFGNSDTVTLQYVSDRVGKLTPQEVVKAPPPTSAYQTRHFDRYKDIGFWEDEQTARERFIAEQRNAETATSTKNAEASRRYEHTMRSTGTPRLTPNEVAAMVAKSHGDAVARSMIVFGKGGEILNLRLAPYFRSSAPALSPNALWPPSSLQSRLQSLPPMQPLQSGIQWPPPPASPEQLAEYAREREEYLKRCANGIIDGHAENPSLNPIIRVLDRVGKWFNSSRRT